MAPRLELHELLTSITEHVYFQPPENIVLQYPCIIYKRDFAETEFADNEPYNHKKRYMVMVIDRNPDSDIPDKIAKIPMSTFNRFYTADDLNHDVFQVFF
jgi:hypothetical protein